MSTSVPTTAAQPLCPEKTSTKPASAWGRGRSFADIVRTQASEATAEPEPAVCKLAPVTDDVSEGEETCISSSASFRGADASSDSEAEPTPNPSEQSLTQPAKLRSAAPSFTPMARPKSDFDEASIVAFIVAAIMSGDYYVSVLEGHLQRNALPADVVCASFGNISVPASALRTAAQKFPPPPGLVDVQKTSLSVKAAAFVPKQT